MAKSTVKLTPDIMKLMRVPRNLWGAKLSEIPGENVCKHKPIIERYVKNILYNLYEGHGLYLYGDYSQGKSAISSIILKAAATYRNIGLFIKAHDVPSYYIDDIYYNMEQTMLERAISVPILVVDELIIKTGSGKAEAYVEQLIRQRIADNQSTVITTNLTTNSLKEKYPALVAVMQEALYPVHVSGHNFREEIFNELKKEF